MKTKRTVTIEFDRVKITTTFNHKNHFWCELCQEDAEFITQTEAVELVKVMQVQGLNIKRENLHLYQSTENQTLICLNSIINCGSNLRIT